MLEEAPPRIKRSMMPLLDIKPATQWSGNTTLRLEGYLRLPSLLSAAGFPSMAAKVVLAPVSSRTHRVQIIRPMLSRILPHHAMSWEETHLEDIPAVFLWQTTRLRRM